MKKYLLTLIVAGLFYSCTNEQKSIGMTTWSDDGKEYKFFLGTQEAVDVVLNYHELISNKMYDEALQIFNDTASVTYYSGRKVITLEMLTMTERRDSLYEANNADYKWNLVNAFSVDLDPNRGGEHVSADYVVTYDDGENKSSFNSILRFYIVDGKIVWVNQFNQSVIDE